jgi:ATP-dependent Clp protease ATP-binding subunit ClpC
VLLDVEAGWRHSRARLDGLASPKVFERFTERAREVVVLAQDEARSLRHDYIGTEHLLLALLREETGIAGRVLESFDMTLEEVRAQIARIVGLGKDDVKTGQIPFTPGARTALEWSLRESRNLGHNYIGTEHILLGLSASRDETVAASCSTSMPTSRGFARPS